MPACSHINLPRGLRESYCNAHFSVNKLWIKCCPNEMLLPRRLLNIRPDTLNNSCAETCQVKQEAHIPSRLRFLMRGSHGLASRRITCFASLSLSPSAAGCTFDEDSDPSLCEFSQGEEDDFDWQLFRAHASPHSTSDLLRGKSAQHCPILIPPVYFTLWHKPFHARGPVHLRCPPTGLIRVTAGTMAVIAACVYFFLGLFVVL